MTILALTRIRGQVHVNKPFRTALTLLGLTKKYATRLLEDTPAHRGIIKKINPYITWGETDQELATTLQKKYQQQTVYNLHPPRGGLERKGIKRTNSLKGAAGYRGKDINRLIKTMLD